MNMNPTEHEERMYEYYKSIEDENHSLKKQLQRKIKQLKNLRYKYKQLMKKYKQATENRKPRYRNNGKGGK